MITRRPYFDRGCRASVWLFGALRNGTVQSGHEWIDKKTGEHMRRRIVLLDKGIEGIDESGKPPRWNVSLSDLRLPLHPTEK